MMIVGVTGGIGSGKTTLCRMFERWGAQVIDADGLGREVVEADPALLKRLEEEFGGAIRNPDGTLNRRELGRLAFKSPAARRRLNSIVHPPLLSLLRERIRRKGGSAPLVIDAALLVEWALSEIIDLLILVRASKELRIRRVGRRWSREEIEQRMALQLSDEEIAKEAGLIIENNGSLQELEAEAHRAWEVINRLGQQSHAPAGGSLDGGG